MFTWISAHCMVSVKITNNIILSYAFKIRQDYLSSSYLDKTYLLSKRSEMMEIWIDQSNVCWDNLFSCQKHMIIFFSYLSLFYRWNLIECSEIVNFLFVTAFGDAWQITNNWTDFLVSRQVLWFPGDLTVQSEKGPFVCLKQYQLSPAF